MTRPRTVSRDESARDKIRRELGTTFLVEAGAGSGKTTSLVERMIALLAAGAATIDTLAAVTFTRKAASQLRGRFQVALEQARLAEKDPVVRQRYEDALTGLERSFIGTIHSFCARLLRERPIEAGVDPDFVELEDHEDRILLEESWDEYQARARIENEAALRGLDEAGLEPVDLESAFKAIAEFPDVEAAAGAGAPPDFPAVRRALEELLDLASKLVPRDKPENGRDPLQALFVRLFRRRRNIGFGDGRRLMESVELFDKKLGLTKNRWASKEDGARLLAAAEAFQDEVARPALRAWREFRHTRALDFLRPAVEFYARRRLAEARLNFQDQLILAARLLRRNPEVRGYFRQRFHPVLVDEFQDTDPIQAEILFLLTGTDDREEDWTRLAPAPGSLFLVGDPKQSIYRFRRADIDIYNLVKERIEASGGETLSLTANFRSLRPIADWVNPLFDPGRGGAFPAAADAYQAGFMPLETVRRPRPNALSGVRKIMVPAVTRHAKEEIAEIDSGRVAGFVAWALAGNLRLDDGRAGLRPARPGDFLILFRYKDRMGKYARKLEEQGIPYEIAGSDAFAENAEIAEIKNLLAALDDPDDPVATVAALRGLFFGLSDQDLIEHRSARGTFCYLGAAGEEAGSARVRRAFASLRAWRELVTRVPPSVALETIFQQSGLLTHLAIAPMGSSRAGNVLKLIEVLRSRENEDMTSFAAAVAFIAEWAGVQPVEEMSLTPGRRDAVLLMNLHKAKGLEAPVVWLANPIGVRDFEPDRHIRRTGMRTPLGHFRFSKPVGPATRTVSQPLGWEESAAEEKTYEAAEEDRLMYVAATRARDLLVISGYQGELGSRNAWGLLAKALPATEDLPECPDAPGAACPPKPRRRRTPIKPEDVARGREELRRRMAGASLASSLHETVTALARREAEAPEWAKGGLGLWGSEVHVMLKSLGESWPADGLVPGAGGALEKRLVRTAHDVLVASGRNTAAAPELAAHVGAIIRSAFWQRAMQAGRRLYEVSFSLRISPADADYADVRAAIGFVPVAGGRPVAAEPGCPVFLSGAVDLLFKEEDGWVIADYKTDRLPAAFADAGEAAREEALGILVDHYRAQVRLYTRLWARTTGERVKESGLYFTALDRWVRIDER